MTRATPEKETENSRLYRRLRQTSISKATTALRNAYRDEWDDLYRQHLEADLTASNNTCWKRADQSLREAHWIEYSANRIVIEAHLQREAGYVSNHRKFQFKSRSVDTPAPAVQDGT